jgi:hypothetical protein
MLQTQQVLLKDEDNSNELVFNFESIFKCWVEGKCTTNYLHKYINETISEKFISELERRYSK